MSPQLPGVSVSILRDRTFGPPSQPITMSGRVTAFGFGVPAFVRVRLEGPQHNPDVRTFAAFAAPLSGNWSVPVLAEKEGRYVVYAEAFAPVGVPLPGGPEPLFLGPPLGESPRPPLAIGTPVDGGVEVETPTGRERVPVPPPTRVEVAAPVSVGPIVVSVPAPVAAPPALPPRAPALAPPPGVPDREAGVTVTPPVIGGTITGLSVE